MGHSRRSFLALTVALFGVACASAQPTRPKAAPTAAPTAPSVPASAPPTAQPMALATTTPPAVARGTGLINVLYAGSLVNIMEKTIGPAFTQQTGTTYQGEGKGSVALANLIKGKIRQADIFISADPTVNDTLMGAKNGSFVSWFLTMARTTIVVAWSPKSRFAADFNLAKGGTTPWYVVLEKPGLRLGRTDPELDPKGYRTIWMVDLAQHYYQKPNLIEKILVKPDNTDQIFPEETLVARLEAGQLDAGIFYLNEAVEAKLPYLTLPDQINQGSPALAKLYAGESFKTKKGTVFTGSPILYTITIPSTTQNLAGATAFVAFMLGPRGQGIFQEHGLLSTPVDVGGAAAAVPASLQPLIKGPYAAP